MLDAELLRILACPACKKPVELRPAGGASHESEQWLVCSACGRWYPVRDDIPVMLIDEARIGGPAGEPPQQSEPAAPETCEES